MTAASEANPFVGYATVIPVIQSEPSSRQTEHRRQVPILCDAPKSDELREGFLALNDD